jgi:Short C-terminal domain
LDLGGATVITNCYLIVFACFVAAAATKSNSGFIVKLLIQCGSSQLRTMSLAENRRKKTGAQTASTITEAERVVANQVTFNRRSEILEYLRLFGYKPDRTILQIHIAGFFNKRYRTRKATEQRDKSFRRYGGTTFTVIGRTHDPSVMDLVIKPKNKREANPGYIGYLWKNKDPHKRAPHEVIPLDFTPSHMRYPEDWKNMFATKGFMVALHVPTSFAKHKNKLSRALYRVGKKVDVRSRWDFIEEVRSTGYGQQAAAEEPMRILKTRLAKGEISQQEYEELRQTLTV